MKKSIKSNMYSNILDGTWDLYGDYLSGQHAGLICVISSRKLSEQANEALQRSFAQLGYGKAACTFVVLEGPHGEAPIRSGTASLPSLSDKELLAAIEGLDPLFLIITDSLAIKTCSIAYRQPIDLDGRSRVFGREVRAFESFEAMLDDPREKQRAWALLKTLPKLEPQ